MKESNLSASSNASSSSLVNISSFPLRTSPMSLFLASSFAEQERVKLV
jgi:hypothetical protein